MENIPHSSTLNPAGAEPAGRANAAPLTATTPAVLCKAGQIISPQQVGLSHRWLRTVLAGFPLTSIGDEQAPWS